MKLSDLLIAAASERAGLTVLHYTATTGALGLTCGHPRCVAFGVNLGPKRLVSNATSASKCHAIRPACSHRSEKCPGWLSTPSHYGEIVEESTISGEGVDFRRVPGTLEGPRGVRGWKERSGNTLTADYRSWGLTPGRRSIWRSWPGSCRRGSG